jgi:glycine/D-amino acid oxidase-like deaminating enzyme
MPTVHYGLSPWLDGVPRVRRPTFARHRGELGVDVAIVGGGLTGCATVYAFAAAGVRVALFERGQIGEGSTAAAPGFVLPDPQVDFSALAALHGVRSARRIFKASRRAALDFAATLRRLRIKCDLQPHQTIVVAASGDQEKRLRKDAQARRDAGLDAAWLTAKRIKAETAIDAAGGISTPGGAQIDPYRACVGLARAAVARGALIFDRSSVRKIRAGRKAVEIWTEGGHIRAATVVIATGSPGPEIQALRRHFTLAHTYSVVTEPLRAGIARQVGRRTAIVGDEADPPHVIGWTRQEGILFSGADQAVVSSRLRAKALVQRTGQLMYELSTIYPALSGIQPLYGWDATIAETADGVPYIGPHRNFPHHLFALGFGRNGAGQSFLASRILLKIFLGDADPAHDVFAFTRTIS